MSSNVCVIRFGARARACATVRQEPHNALQGTLWYSGHLSFMVPDGARGEGGVKPGLVRLSAMKMTQGLPFPRVFYALQPILCNHRCPSENQMPVMVVYNRRKNML